MTTAGGVFRGLSGAVKYIYFSSDGGTDLWVGTAPSKEMGARPTHPRLLFPPLVSRESSPTLCGWTVRLVVVNNHAVFKHRHRLPAPQRHQSRNHPEARRLEDPRGHAQALQDPLTAGDGRGCHLHRQPGSGAASWRVKIWGEPQVADDHKPSPCCPSASQKPGVSGALPTSSWISSPGSPPSCRVPATPLPECASQFQKSL